MSASGDDVGGIVDVDQDADVVVGQRVAALLGGRARLVDDEVGRHRLLFQPLAGVAVVDAGRVGELGGGERASVGERGVEAEGAAQVHAVHLERSGDALHEAFVQGDGHGDLLILGEPAGPGRSGRHRRPKAGCLAWGR